MTLLTRASLRKMLRIAFFLGLGMAVPVAPAVAADLTEGFGGIRVQVNMARILRIDSPAQTVIIGNPAIADVTIQDPRTLVLTGRGYGSTNLIILDAAGNPIADTVIEVVQAQAGLITVYQGSARTTLACSPNCQPVIMLGDDVTFTAQTISSSGLIAGAAN